MWLLPPAQKYTVCFPHRNRSQLKANYELQEVRRWMMPERWLHKEQKEKLKTMVEKNGESTLRLVGFILKSQENQGIPPPPRVLS